MTLAVREAVGRGSSNGHRSTAAPAAAKQNGNTPRRTVEGADWELRDELGVGARPGDGVRGSNRIRSTRTEPAPGT